MHHARIAGRHLAQRGVGAGDDRRVEGARLEQREPEALLAGGEDHDHGVLVAPAQDRVVGSTDPPHPPGGLERDQRGAGLGVGAAVGPDDDEIEAAGPVVPPDAGEEPEVLARRQVADGERERSGRWRCRGLGRDRREIGAHTVRHDLALRRPPGVERGEPGAGGVAHRDEPVGVVQGAAVLVGEQQPLEQRVLVGAGDREDVVDDEHRRRPGPGHQVLAADDDVDPGAGERGAGAVTVPQAERHLVGPGRVQDRVERGTGEPGDQVGVLGGGRHRQTHVGAASAGREHLPDVAADAARMGDGVGQDADARLGSAR